MRYGFSGAVDLQYSIIDPTGLTDEGFADLQSEVRRSVTDHLDRASDRIRVDDRSSAHDEAVRVAEHNVEASLGRLGAERLSAVATPPWLATVTFARSCTFRVARRLGTRIS